MSVSIYKYFRLKALSDTIDFSDDYFYRKICREFSIKFNTPLLEVESLPQEYILQHYYENMHEDIELEDMPEIISETLNPQGSNEYEDEMQEWIDKSVREEADKKQKKQDDEIKLEEKPKKIEMSFKDEEFGEDND